MNLKLVSAVVYLLPHNTSAFRMKMMIHKYSSISAIAEPILIFNALCVVGFLLSSNLQRLYSVNLVNTVIWKDQVFQKHFLNNLNLSVGKTLFKNNDGCDC